MAESQTNSPLEILVVEDDFSLRELLRELIAASGASVTTAVNGQDGIIKYLSKLSSGYPYDAVLTDFRMPKATGKEVIRIVKTAPQKTPVVLMSGYDIRDLRSAITAELNGLKPDGYLHKPVDVNVIAYLVNWVKSAKANPKSPPEFKPPTDGFYQL